MIRRSGLVVRGMALAGLAVGAAEMPEPPLAMARAAREFLAALDPAQRARASFPFDSEERFDWHFIPRERRGLPLKEMSAEERHEALALLKSSLSERGFIKVDTILHLEEVLLAIEGRAIRDPDRYYFTVFGDPSDRGTWGWRYEGHHVSLNWTVVDGRLAASTPQFLGANPSDVRDGPQRGTRALAAEEDVGRALVKSLRADQAARAVLGRDAPDDILTGSSRAAASLGDAGIPYGQLDQEQQGRLLSLIEEYASAQPPSVARARRDRVKAELQDVRFAWMGGLEKGQRHYYRVQGSTFLIEYDNTQDGANHIHCVWRELEGDWGRDVLADHYRTAPHHARAGRGQGSSGD